MYAVAVTYISKFSFSWRYYVLQREQGAVCNFRLKITSIVIYHTVCVSFWRTFEGVTQVSYNNNKYYKVTHTFFERETFFLLHISSVIPIIILYFHVNFGHLQPQGVNINKAIEFSSFLAWRVVYSKEKIIRDILWYFVRF